MELTESYKRVFPPSVLGRYEFLEVRSAAATLAGASPQEFDDLVQVLDGFAVSLDNLVERGRNKTDIARA